MTSPSRLVFRTPSPRLDHCQHSKERCQTLTNNRYQTALPVDVKITVSHVNDSDRGRVGDLPLTGRHQTPNHLMGLSW